MIRKCEKPKKKKKKKSSVWHRTITVISTERFLSISIVMILIIKIIFKQYSLDMRYLFEYKRYL